ncbi:ImmA/IrrE family metallo-endopeptidase [Longivirga aurantiaca]|uniref:ImmA/IrrE family metallo-endopeptidase n=1 Tax=Longivirga aurantiaca TaxID=1837743 RepID=A0ABW1T3T7_9ACTN
MGLRRPARPPPGIAAASRLRSCGPLRGHRADPANGAVPNDVVRREGKSPVESVYVRVNWRNDLSSPATDREGILANRFAAALLMPEDAVRGAVSDLRVRSGSTSRVVELLAEQFDVSAEEMGTGSSTEASVLTDMKQRPQPSAGGALRVLHLSTAHPYGGAVLTRTELSRARGGS